MKKIALALVLPTILSFVPLISYANEKSLSELQREMSIIQGLACWKVPQSPDDAEGINSATFTFLEQKLIDHEDLGKDEFDFLKKFSFEKKRYVAQANSFIQSFEKYLKEQKLVLNFSNWDDALGAFYCNPDKDYSYKIKLTDDSIKLVIFNHVDPNSLFFDTRPAAEFVFKFDRDSAGKVFNADLPELDALTKEGEINQNSKSPLVHLLTVMKIAGLNNLTINVQRIDDRFRIVKSQSYAPSNWNSDGPFGGHQLH